MKTALITGAAGFIGSQLVEAFAGAGYEVRASDRPGTDLSIAEGCGAEIAPADLLDGDGIGRITDGVDVVVNAAAVFDLASSYRAMHAVNVEGVDRLCTAAFEAGVDRFIQFSSVAVYGVPKSIPCREEARKRPTEPYARTKWAGESVAMRHYRDTGLPVTVLRPTLVYGPRSRYGLAVYMSMMALCKASGKDPYLIEGGPLTHYVHVEDVVGAALLLARSGGVMGKAFNIADDEPIRAGDMFRTLTEIFDLRPGRTFRYVAAVWRPLVRLALTLGPRELKGVNARGRKGMKRMVERYGLEPAFDFHLDKGWLSYMRGDQCYDNSAIKALGLTLQHPSFTEGIRETVGWYRENRWLPDFDAEAPAQSPGGAS